MPGGGSTFEIGRQRLRLGFSFRLVGPELRREESEQNEKDEEEGDREIGDRDERGVLSFLAWSSTPRPDRHPGSVPPAASRRERLSLLDDLLQLAERTGRIPGSVPARIGGTRPGWLPHPLRASSRLRPADDRGRRKRSTRLWNSWVTRSRALRVSVAADCAFRTASSVDRRVATVCSVMRRTPASIASAVAETFRSMERFASTMPVTAP